MRFSTWFSYLRRSMKNFPIHKKVRSLKFVHTIIITSERLNSACGRHTFSFYPKIDCFMLNIIKKFCVFDSVKQQKKLCMIIMTSQPLTLRILFLSSNVCCIVRHKCTGVIHKLNIFYTAGEGVVRQKLHLHTFFKAHP